MKKILLVLLVLPLLTSCKQNVESIISEVYGSEVIGLPEDGGLSFKLDYSEVSPTKRDADLNKFKNKFDVLTNSIGKQIDEIMNSDEKGYGTFYLWESPTLRILLVDNRSLIEENTYLIINVIDKTK